MSQTKPTDVEIEKFAKAIVLDGKTQADAFRVAFPESKAKPESAQRIAVNISQMVTVRSRIEQLKQEAKEESQRHFGATLQWKTQMLMKAVELGYSVRIDDKGNEIPNGIGAAVSAIAELNRMAGDHAPTRSELTGKNGAPLSPAKVEWTITPVAPPSHES
jgi:hypothetical protein